MFESSKLFKLFLMMFLPLILLSVFTVLWIVLYLISRRLVPDIKKNILISFVSILFLLHPMLAQKSLSVFQ